MAHDAGLSRDDAAIAQDGGPADGGMRCGAGDGCVCEPVGSEPNESRDRGALLTRELTNNPPSEVDFTEWNIDRTEDQDWALQQVYNSGSPGPEITVRVTSPPGEAPYEVAGWYSCGAPPTCAAGTFDDSEGVGGCVGPGLVTLNALCEGGGVLTLRVRAPSWNGACAPYRLQIEVR